MLFLNNLNNLKHQNNQERSFSYIIFIYQFHISFSYINKFALNALLNCALFIVEIVQPSSCQIK